MCNLSQKKWCSPSTTCPYQQSQVELHVKLHNSRYCSFVLFTQVRMLISGIDWQSACVVATWRDIIQVWRRSRLLMSHYFISGFWSPLVIIWAMHCMCDATWRSFRCRVWGSWDVWLMNQTHIEASFNDNNKANVSSSFTADETNTYSLNLSHKFGVKTYIDFALCLRYCCVECVLLIWMYA